MKTHPISSDARYTVEREWTGQSSPRFVARFCGEWIGQNASYPAAVLFATVHRLQRQGALVIVEQPSVAVEALTVS
jgi:hypothetical protein